MFSKKLKSLITSGHTNNFLTKKILTTDNAWQKKDCENAFDLPVFLLPFYNNFFINETMVDFQTNATKPPWQTPGTMVLIFYWP